MTNARGDAGRRSSYSLPSDNTDERRIATLSGFVVVVPAGTPRDLVAAAIAERQRGRTCRSQLLDGGWTSGAIISGLDLGRLTATRTRGVYVVGADTKPSLARETEILLGAGPNVALAGISVLQALGLARAPGDRVHVISQTGSRRNSRGAVIFHHFGDLDRSADIRTFEGLPMTTVERALLDSADGGTLSPRETERALDEATARRLTSRTKLREALDRVEPVRHPAHALLSVLADRRRPNSRTESELAEAALALIRAAGLPEPTTEASLYGYRADKYWPDARVALEVDSFSWHGLVRENFNRDRRKDRVYAEQGILVVRWSDDDIANRPLELVTQLGMTIARRSAERAQQRPAA